MEPASRLRRVLDTRGAIVVGLGAMIGTGVFAVWTPAYSLVGPWLLVCLPLAAIVAGLNATSTVMLARSLPQSGGAYAYGRAYVGRPAGLIAGYSFVIGKSSSAAAAALTIGAYVWPDAQRWLGLLALALALALDLRGIVKSARVTAILVAVVMVILVGLCLAWWVRAPVAPWSSDAGFPGGSPGVAPLLAASGLLFVAFAGYARITVLGEEVRSPATTIPRAVAVSFAIVIMLYLIVAVTVVGAVMSGVHLTTAPLEAIAEFAGGGFLGALVRVAAVLAAGAVLLSLLAGVGRTLFAMADAGDAPRPLARVHAGTAVPVRGDVTAAILAGLVTVIGGIGAALALSAATVLTYYAVAHLAAWRRGARLVPAAGLVGCAAIVGGLVATALG